jgi:hypothetical protein
VGGADSTALLLCEVRTAAGDLRGVTVMLSKCSKVMLTVLQSNGYGVREWCYRVLESNGYGFILLLCELSTAAGDLRGVIVILS